MIDSHRTTCSPLGQGFAPLIAAARSGNDSDVGQLLEATRRYLLLVANRSLDAPLQQKVAPSDLVQEAFIDAHRDFRRFEGNTETELFAWLCHILKHKAADAGRRFRGAAKRNVHEERPLTECIDSPDLLVAAQEPSPSTVAIRSENQQRLMSALSRLPVNYRRVIELRSLERLSFAEVGRRLERNEDAVGKLWYRALQRLREELAGYDGSEISHPR